MSNACSAMERARSGLWEVILGELGSWPELHRQVFVQSHYRGQSVEKISSCLGLRMPEVRLILQQCDRRLRQALKAFRGSAHEMNSSPAMQPPSATQNDFLF